MESREESSVQPLTHNQRPSQHHTQPDCTAVMVGGASNLNHNMQQSQVRHVDSVASTACVALATVTLPGTFTQAGLNKWRGWHWLVDTSHARPDGMLEGLQIFLPKATPPDQAD